MSVTIQVNGGSAGLTLCHKGSNGVSAATIPDVCKTPSPGGPVPIPYPNVAKSSDLAKGTTTVKADGGNMCANYGSEFSRSTGDEAGTAGGVTSGTFIKEATWITYSFDVKLEGKGACRLSDKMFHNHQNTVNLAGELQAPLPSALEAKAACYRCRKELSEAGKASKDPKTKEAGERLGRENHDLEQAKLSKDVYPPDPLPEPYDPKASTPPGWKNVSDDPEALKKYGLSPDQLEKPPSEFRAQMYEPDPAVFGNDMKPTVAFKGTTFSSMADWKNNAAQGLGLEADYYKQAVGIGGELAKNGADVQITGHSLGGGLASAASGTSGLDATTFNAAGLAGNTIKDSGAVVKSSNINAYRVSGEILTNTQELSLGSALTAYGIGGVIGGVIGGGIGLFFGGAGVIPGALAGAATGAKIAGVSKTVISVLAPNAVGTPYELPGTGLDPVDRHGMDQVIAGMEKQIDEDQTTLEKATGRKCNC